MLHSMILMGHCAVSPGNHDLEDDLEDYPNENLATAATLDHLGDVEDVHSGQVDPGPTILHQ